MQIFPRREGIFEKHKPFLTKKKQISIFFTNKIATITKKPIYLLNKTLIDTDYLQWVHLLLDPPQKSHPSPQEVLILHHRAPPLQKDVTRTSLCCRHFCVFSSLILETGGIFNCPGRLPMQMDLPATSPPHIFIMFTIHSSSSLPHISIILAHILTKSIRFWRGKT